MVEEAPETKGPIVLDPELRDWPTPAPKPEPPTVRGTVMTTGAVIFVSGYAVPFGVGALAGALADSDDTWAPLVPLLVPVGGPLITGALYDTPAPTWALLGADAGIQAVGLITLAVGAMMDEPDHRATARPTANGFLLRF
ncbi:MAG: hypothetical protein KC731_24820 [Myxococcales bacterium]|nr:hypothetical protein [Myxococcales bacterium]